jgi:hypothetical protein
MDNCKEASCVTVAVSGEAGYCDDVSSERRVCRARGNGSPGQARGHNSASRIAVQCGASLWFLPLGVGDAHEKGIWWMPWH